MDHDTIMIKMLPSHREAPREGDKGREQEEGKQEKGEQESEPGPSKETGNLAAPPPDLSQRR